MMKLPQPHFVASICLLLVLAACTGTVQDTSPTQGNVLEPGQNGAEVPMDGFDKVFASSEGEDLTPPAPPST